MGIKDKANALLKDATELKQAAEAMKEAVAIIADNKERLEKVESAVGAMALQLESLEHRYSELLYVVGESRRSS